EYEKGLKKFLYEARTLARMEKQPEIVMVRDYFEANGTAYIVMEYVDGVDFVELRKQRGGRIPPDELFRLMEPLFAALSEVHKAGLLHRDISPDNLMLEKGKIRLLDFGCAREVTVGAETMTIALKQGYGPIEQYQGKGQGPWTDVYALSATIYCCLTGTKPPQALDRTLDDKLIPPRELGVDISPEQQKALLKGMAVNPARRYQSAEELYGGLYSNAAEEPQENRSGKTSAVIPAVTVTEVPDAEERSCEADAGVTEDAAMPEPAGENAKQDVPGSAAEWASDATETAEAQVDTEEETDIAEADADAENEQKTAVETGKADVAAGEGQGAAIEDSVAGEEADAAGETSDVKKETEPGEENEPEKTSELAPANRRDEVTVSGFVKRHAALLGIFCAAAAVVIIAVGVHSHRGNDSLLADPLVTNSEDESESDTATDDAAEDTGTEIVSADISDYDKEAIFADAEPVEDYDALLEALAGERPYRYSFRGRDDFDKASSGGERQPAECRYLV
ncbi:MAG: protein kinase, partial [Clostridiales bacterium]|nr:protein kinase [Clostridiales bacterium]